MSRYRNVLSRRTMLRGAGSIAVALPFLDAMRSQSVWGAEPEPPARCITLFFGLGVPKAMQQEGFSGPLEPLQPHASKLKMFRNVNMTEAGGTGHPRGGTCVFVGEGSSSGEYSAGASIDQVMKGALYPDGVPTPIGTLAVGQFFRRAHGLYQRIRCWNEDGSRTVEPIEAPSVLFDEIFGSFQQEETTDPEQEKHQRLRRSILDTVLDQYEHFTGAGSPLGAASKSKLVDHLDRIRELEKKIFADDVLAGCNVPGEPTDPDLPYGFSGATEYDAVQVSADEFQAAFRLNCDLYAMALRCDLVRFGNIMFESSGGHTAFTGTYQAPSHTYEFRSEASDHNNWHESRQEDMRWHAHFFQSNVAYALSVLDDPEYLEENGNTVLDNALVVVGTETGTNHNMDGVFHAVAGGNGRFDLGGFHDDEVHAVDIYNTCIHAYGVEGTMGSTQHYGGDVTALLA